MHQHGLVDGPDREVFRVIREVPELARIEAEAVRATAHLRSPVESLDGAFSLFDDQDRVELINPAFQRLLGHAIDGPIVGRRFDELLDASLGAGVFDPGSDSLASLAARWRAYHQHPSGVLELRTRGGRALRMTVRPTAEGGRVSLVSDITDDVLQVDALRRARSQAEAALAAQNELLASLSHDLRSPLNAVLGFADLLQRMNHRRQAVRNQRLVRVIRGGEHLLSLIDALDLSRRPAP